MRFRSAHRVALSRLVTAMSLDEAASILGVSPSARPEEILKAYRVKVLENHPDRGGDLSKMVQINLAKEVLDGKQAPTYDSSYDSYSEPQKPPPPPVEITFEEALQRAHVPSGVEWKLVGSPSFGGSGDKSIAGCVVYGQRDTQHVFVSLYHREVNNAFTREKRDEWFADVVTEPLSKPMDRLLPVVFKAMYSKFDGVRKGFSGKVALAGDKIPKLTESVMWFKGRDMSLQDALSQLGGETAPAPGKKLSVVMQLVSTGNDFPRDEGIVFIINGREFPLEKASNEFVIKRTKILPAVFGNYYYFDSSKKDLTRAKKGKSVLKFLAEKLTGEPQSLRDLLQTASDQMPA